MTSDDVLRILARRLDRPLESLVELDRRPLPSLLHRGPLLTVTLRDKVSREVIEPTLDLTTRELVDATALRQRDQEAVQRRAALTPRLGRLLLRHPDLPTVEVLVIRRGRTERVILNPVAILTLADAPDVTQLDVAVDPEIRD